MTIPYLNNNTTETMYQISIIAQVDGTWKLGNTDQIDNIAAGLYGIRWISNNKTSTDQGAAMLLNNRHTTRSPRLTTITQTITLHFACEESVTIKRRSIDGGQSWTSI